MKSKSAVLSACMLIAMLVLVLVPIVTAERDDDVVSDVDNRKLQERPDSFDPAQIEAYCSDRIGFRREMIGAYSFVNDKLFHVMEHPTYEYGKDGYVFFKFEDVSYDNEFTVAFADYIAAMRDYCEQRNIPFLYVISPEKARVYNEYVPDYIGCLSFSSDVLKPLLDERGVEYVDQGEALMAAKEEGRQVFNVTYDAGHWNSEGMYAGSQAVLDKLQSMGMQVDDISLRDYVRNYEEQTTLPASYYPIHEETFKYQHVEEGAANLVDGAMDGLVLDETYRTTSYWTCEEQKDAPALLMFQGSYYNTQGTMLQNQFSSSALVHDYENVFNLPYYVDVFRPDVVVFENADYTVQRSYYDADALTDTLLPDSLNSYDSFESVDGGELEISCDVYSSIANYSLKWEGERPDDAYCIMDGEVYDAIVAEDGTIWWGSPSTVARSASNVEVVLVEKDNGIKKIMNGCVILNELAEVG